MIQLGRYKLISVVNGTFRLDGGAMYGVVPRVLWARQDRPDEDNRIALAMRTLIAVDEAARRVILVDTGAGHKWPEEEAARFALKPDREAISRGLATFGLAEHDVTDIIVTHLHFDHNGGLTEWADKPGGQTRLRFPQARHWIHRKQWEHALHPTDRDRASFLARDIDALRPPGVLTFIDGDQPDATLPGILWFVSNGHTPAQLLPIFLEENHRAALLFTGDVIPTSGHLKTAWLMAYDLFPLTTLEEKNGILHMCRKHGTWLTFPHDAQRGGVELEPNDDKTMIKRVLDL